MRRLTTTWLPGVAACMALWAVAPADAVDAAPQSAPEPLTVVTYNIRYENAGDGDNGWMHRREAMAAYLNETGADIIGLQEVLPQQRAYLAAHMPDYAWYGVGRDDDQDRGEGTPIFFRVDRFDPIDMNTFWLSPTPDVPGSRGWDAALPRVASWVKLRDRRSGRELLAINTHFDHRGPEARLQSSRLLLRRIEELATAGQGRLPVVLTGDFNSRSEQPPYAAVTVPGDPSLALLDAQHVSREPHRGGDSTSNNFKAIHPGVKIDYVFVRDVPAVVSHRIEDPRVDGRFVSDHLPIVVGIELGDGRKAAPHD